MPDIRVTEVLDDFQRPDEDPLYHGGDWAYSGFAASGYSWMRLAGHLGALRAGVAGADQYWTTAFNNETIEIWGLAHGGNAAGAGWGLNMYTGSGIGTSGVDGYCMRQEVGTGGGASRFYRITNSVRTSLASGPSSFTSGASNPILLYRYTKSTFTHQLFHSIPPYTTWTQRISFVDTVYVPPFYVSLQLRDNSRSSLVSWTTVGGGVPTDFIPQIILRPRAWK